MSIKKLIWEVKTEEALLDMLKKAGENVSNGDIEVAEETPNTTSFDVYLNGEPHQFDVDKDGQVYYYDYNKAVELGFIDNMSQLVVNYKKLKGI